MDYDRWLQQPYDEAAQRTAAIEQMIEDVLKEDEFNPLKAETFCTAISEGVIDDIPKAVLEEALNDPNPGFAKLGRLVYEAVYRWCYASADDEAAHRYNNSLG